MSSIDVEAKLARLHTQVEQLTNQNKGADPLGGWVSGDIHPAYDDAVSVVFENNGERWVGVDRYEGDHWHYARLYGARVECWIAKPLAPDELPQSILAPHEHIKELEAEIARLRAEREWVSVEERPLHSDIELRYLATDGDEVVPAQLVHRTDDSSFWWAYESREMLWFTPTHYMPLPAAPEVTP